MIMHFDAWNIRGLNTSVKKHEIGVYTRSNRVSIIGILETRIRVNNLSKVLPMFTKEWEVESIDTMAANIRILLLWKTGEVEVVVLQKTAQLIHCRVKSKNVSLMGLLLWFML